MESEALYFHIVKMGHFLGWLNCWGCELRKVAMWRGLLEVRRSKDWEARVLNRSSTWMLNSSIVFKHGASGRGMERLRGSQKITIIKMVRVVYLNRKNFKWTEIFAGGSEWGTIRKFKVNSSITVIFYGHPSYDQWTTPNKTTRNLSTGNALL